MRLWKWVDNRCRTAVRHAHWQTKMSVYWSGNAQFSRPLLSHWQRTSAYNDRKLKRRSIQTSLKNFQIWREKYEDFMRVSIQVLFRVLFITVCPACRDVCPHTHHLLRWAYLCQQLHSHFSHLLPLFLCQMRTGLDHFTCCKSPVSLRKLSCRPLWWYDKSTCLPESEGSLNLEE